MVDYDTTPKEGATSEVKTPIASTEKSVNIFGKEG